MVVRRNVHPYCLAELGDEHVESEGSVAPPIAGCPHLLVDDATHIDSEARHYSICEYSSDMLYLVAHADRHQWALTK